MKIRWIEKKDRDSLDPIFYKLKINQHGLSNIDDYGKYIDKITNSVFVKNEILNVVFNVGTPESVNVLELKDFIDNFVELMQAVKNMMILLVSYQI